MNHHSFIGLETVSSDVALRLPLSFRKLSESKASPVEGQILHFNPIYQGYINLHQSYRPISKMFTDAPRVVATSNVTEKVATTSSQYKMLSLAENSHKPFRLFSACFITQGHTRSLISDPQREAIYFVPVILGEILTKNQGLSFTQLVEKYGEANRSHLVEYFEFLLERQLIFFLEDDWEQSAFPALDLSAYESAPVIEHLILDIGQDTNYDPRIVLEQLKELGVFHVEIRYYTSVSLDKLSYLEALKDTMVKSVEVLLPYQTDYTPEFIKAQKLREKYPWLLQITFFDAPEAQEVKEQHLLLSYTPQTVSSAQHCGKIGYWAFANDLPMITLNQSHNSCLYKTMGIDENGFIKNCPSMQENFGHINNTSLTEAVAKPGFRKHWNTHKAQIEVCKICEFRDICSDCRAYTQNDDPYGKPLKCGYDPYVGEWITNTQLIEQTNLTITQ
ncbi:grasp-with-spasm system SPASM domain peptide maturase [marine bacterium AO1-C]|nr:grasp-with-spasm system SPASM domain peptide maturase [marine bacterium AO1-C]